MFLFIKKKIQHFINRKKQKRDYPENVDFSIGMLQIENLIHNNVSFLFFNLGESVQLKTKKK